MSGNLPVSSDLNVSIKKARSDSPQLLLYELAAWLESGISESDTRAEDISMIGMCIPQSYKPVKSFVRSISNAERVMSRPALRYVLENNSQTGFMAIVARYFSYVWIDATATSAVVSALYTNSLKKAGSDHSRFNAIYPILVSILGTPLKAALVAVSIPALVILMGTTLFITAFDKLFSTIGYGHPFQKTLGGLSAMYRPLLGIVATVAISNINPLILLKTLVFDPISCVQTIDKINSQVKNKEDVPSPVEVRIENPAESLPKIHKEPASEVIATFDIQDGLRGDIVKWVANNLKSFGNNYMLIEQLPAPAAGMGGLISTVLKFNVCDPYKKEQVFGTISTTIGSANSSTLTLSFNGAIEESDRNSIVEGFAKMVKSIHGKARSTKTDIDISGCPDLSENVINNIKSDNISIIDTYAESRSATQTPNPYIPSPGDLSKV